MAENKNEISITGDGNIVNKPVQINNDNLNPPETKLAAKLKFSLTELVKANKLGDVILLLEKNRPELKDTLVLLTRSLNKVKMDEIKEIRSQEALTIQYNKIANSLMDIINDNGVHQSVK